MEGTSRASVEAYRAKLQKVIVLVDRRLDEALPLERLAAVAGCSKFHFHRQFSALFGLSLHDYVHTSRMKRAYYMLAFRAAPVTDVALDAGYAGPEAFSRAFKRALGLAPSEVRRAPSWEAARRVFAPLLVMRSRRMKTERSLSEVRIVDFPAVKVALLEHRGSPERYGETLRVFIGWRRRTGLSPAVSATYNVVYDDPSTTPPDEHRFGLAAATDRPIAPNDEGVTGATLPAGRCAVIRHHGSDDLLGHTLRFLYAEWLPQSGEALRDVPLVFQRVSFFPDVPEAEAITDVFLPLV